MYSIIPNTKLDRILSLTACVYYVDYPFLIEEIKNNNYLNLIFENFSKYLTKNDQQTYKIAIEKIKPILFDKYLN